MTIKEVEMRTGLLRSNIRFYEKEGLIIPSRNENNGYRDYSESDVENIKKIAYLRTLGISIEDIRNMIAEKVSLYQVIQKQNKVLENQISDLSQAKAMCEKILAAENIAYKELQVAHYVTELQEYWKDNQPVFKLDSVRFLYIWGSFVTWILITAVCFLAALLFYAKLPPEIPVQWHDGAASSLADKNFIFAYPAACAVIRYLLRPFLYAKLQRLNRYVEIIAEYVTNYICFAALSVEIFTILFVYGAVKNVAVVIITDTVVLFVLLMTGIVKKERKGNAEY